MNGFVPDKNVVFGWLTVAVGCLCINPPAVGQVSDKSELPAGYYVYMGPDPGGRIEKKFYISPDGGINWPKDKPPEEKKAEDAKKPGGLLDKLIPGQPREPGPDDNFEVYKYPLIKWKSVSITGGPSDALARLSTTYEVDQTRYIGRGMIKYKLVVQARQRLLPIGIQLLDENGFLLAEFAIESEFLPQKGPAGYQTLVSKGNFYCDEKLYKRMRGYSVR